MCFCYDMHNFFYHRASFFKKLLLHSVSGCFDLFDRDFVFIINSRRVIYAHEM